jgi:phosphate transport system substrate-binding protein
VAAGAGALGVLLLAAACSSSSASPTSGSSGSSSVINGAGSTFAAPMYQQWAGQYHQSVSNGVQINYQAVGSGGGISEFTQGVVDFGATDAPMTGTEKAAAQAGQGSVVLHIPMIIGAVALVYNEPGLKSLTLDGPTLAKIYLGDISKWNDPAIKKLNPGVTLPSDAIQPCRPTSARLPWLSGLPGGR